MFWSTLQMEEGSYGRPSFQNLLAWSRRVLASRRKQDHAQKQWLGLLLLQLLQAFVVPLLGQGLSLTHHSPPTATLTKSCWLG
jgi:hypothetical protein